MLEDRLPDGFECRVHLAVELDLVVKCAEDGGDGALFEERWENDFHVAEKFCVQRRHCCPNSNLTDMLLECRKTEEPR